jgi:hypothetical protein
MAGQYLRLGAGWLVLFLACGCSSFNRDWKAVAAQPPPPNGMDGRWLGVWRSEVTGHSGQLRCLVTLEPTQQYQARFRAKYGKILTFSFSSTVPLQVVTTNAQFWFRGEADLGWYAGGVYHYEGRVNQTNFLSTYRCERDHGTFEMGRPNPKQ